MSLTILEQSNQKAERAISELYRLPEDTKPEQKKQLVKNAQATLEMLQNHMRLDYRGEKHLDLAELTTAADYRILFPKAVMGVLQRPVEPKFVGQMLLTKSIQLNGAKIMQFPSFAGIRAGGPFAPTQEIPESDLGFTLHTSELRVRKWGVRVAVEEDIIKDSQWDLLSLYLDAMRNAMKRRKEERIWFEYEDKSQVFIDNSLTASTNWSKGRSSGNALNGTFDHEDLIDMIAGLGANGFTASHVVVHPLMWAVFQKDPFLSFQMLWKGGMGQHFGSYPQGKDSITDGSQFMVPFGIQTIVTPFQAMTLGTTLTTGVTGFGSANYGSVTVLDDNAGIIELVQEGLTMKEWPDNARDIRSIQIHE